jgi:hypothetical protein
MDVNSKPRDGQIAPAFDTIAQAAEKLGVDPEALRARCRRATRRHPSVAAVSLGGGIVAFKFGSSWRIRFPPALAEHVSRGPRP